MLRLALALPVLLVIAGCGTISRGASGDIVIDVTPANATIRTSHGPACFGPCTIRASRAQDFTVTASAPGHVTQSVEVTRRVSLAGAGGVARNALGGPTVVGVGVDLYTRAAYDHVPNPVVIRLERNPSNTVARPGPPR